MFTAKLFGTQDFTKKKLYLRFVNLFTKRTVSTQTIREAIFTFLSSISSKYTELRYETVSRMPKTICQLVDVYIVKGLSWPYRSKGTRAIFRKIPLSQDSRFKPSERPSRPFSARKSAEASKRRSSRTGIEIANG